jgi:hypothetical protein
MHRNNLAGLQQAAGNDQRQITQVLHNHLNKSGTAQLADIIAEIGRQITPFNEGVKEADQENPAIKRMVEAGKDANIRIQQAADGLSKFNDIWPKLNKKLKE